MTKKKRVGKTWIMLASKRSNEFFIPKRKEKSFFVWHFAYIRIKISMLQLQTLHEEQILYIFQWIPGKI